MSNRGKSGLADKYQSEIIESMEEFAGNMEESFGQIHRHFTTFKIQISQIKKRKLLELQQINPPKSEIAKKKSQAKSALNAKKKEGAEKPINIEELSSILSEDISIISFDETKDSTLKNNLQKYSQMLTRDAQRQYPLDSDLVIDDLLDDIDLNWINFYENEKLRLQQIDPKASMPDIVRFAESQWSKMTEQEKREWKGSAQKKKEGKHFQMKKDKTLAGLMREEREKQVSGRFSDFLSRKIVKTQVGPSPAPVVEIEQVKVSNPKTVSASSLLFALEQKRQKKQELDTQSEKKKLKQIFNTFQL